MTRTVLPQKSPLTRSPTAPALSREGRASVLRVKHEWVPNDDLRG
jgi:hypothetical protein